MTTTTMRGTTLNLTNPIIQSAICTCQEMCKEGNFLSEVEKIIEFIYW